MWHNEHWYLCVVDIVSEEVLIYDSMRGNKETDMSRRRFVETMVSNNKYFVCQTFHEHNHHLQICKVILNLNLHMFNNCLDLRLKGWKQC